jgi:hypothetical protein
MIKSGVYLSTGFEVTTGGKKVSVSPLQGPAEFKITIKNLNTATTVDIQYTPESIADSYTASFSEHQILGRSSPVLIYTGGSSRGLSFSVVLHEDLVPGKDLAKFCDKIRALSFPVYENGVREPRVYAKIGSMYSFWGVVNTTITYKPPVRDGKMIIAEVSFEFTRMRVIRTGTGLINDDAISAYEVERGIDRG